MAEELYICSGGRRLPVEPFRVRFGLSRRARLPILHVCNRQRFIWEYWRFKRVVAVEPDPNRVACLKFNRTKFGWNMDIVADYASPGVVERVNPDFIKCDIEGFEMDLIDVLARYPCVLEVHSGWVEREFARRGFYPISESYDRMLTIRLMSNVKGGVCHD